MAEITFQTTELINYSEAAQMLLISRQTLYAWIEKGLLHPLAIGRSRYLFRSEIELIGQKKEGAVGRV